MDDNKRNLFYFEASSMRGLYQAMEQWQSDNNKRLLSVSIEHDGLQFCCIALSNPTEVYIVGPDGKIVHTRTVPGSGTVQLRVSN
jgi:hypothetical protein